ncbi:MAG: DUF4249 family protein, partial [Bacteroidales bacterium]|nr:DUF4249 family protein [Bacteroidales bacterium]
FRADFDNANVYIYQDDNCLDTLYHNYTYLSLQYAYTIGNYWSKKVVPQPGKEYKIVVKAPGLPDAMSITQIPEMVKIEHVDTTWALVTNNNRTSGQLICHINFTDPPNKKNYYLLNISAKRPKHWPEEPDYPYVVFNCNDPVVEEKIIENPLMEGIDGIVFSDKTINGENYDLKLSVSDERYDESFLNDPNFNFIDYEKTTYFRLYTISEEYYKYLQSLILYYSKVGNPFTEPVHVFSNINGGYGIFAGAAVSCDSIVQICKTFTVKQ